MITKLADIRDNFAVEEGCTDIFLQQRLNECEAFMADKFEHYTDWDADDQETTYAKQRRLVRSIVCNMVLCVLFRQYGFVFTSFGIVSKNDPDSRGVSDDERFNQALAYEAWASLYLRQLHALEGMKYNFTKDLSEFLQTAKAL